MACNSSEDSLQPASAADCTNQQSPRQISSRRKSPTSPPTTIISYHPIYLFLFVTLIPEIVFTLQLPQPSQQQTELESLLQQQETKCLNCIRTVSSTGVDLTRRCEGYYCGPFQISYQYWAEAGKPGNSQGTRDYEKCARDKQCAESTVKAYFKKFKRDCNNDGFVDCLDMAALHKGGPQSCAQDWFYKSRYWQAFNKTACATDVRDPTAMAAQKTPDKKEPPVQNRQAITKNQTLTGECLDCICEALSSCSSSHSLSASNCGSGTVCGPFAISQTYWKDGRRPGASWTACARTKECSSVTIRNYMDKYKRDCNGDGFVTCEDYAAIHRRGPKSCMNRDLLKEQFWARFLACRANQKPNNDANLVKVDEGDDSQAGGILASRGASTSVSPSATQPPSPPSPSPTTTTTTTPAPPPPPTVTQTITTRFSSPAKPVYAHVNSYEYSLPSTPPPSLKASAAPIPYDLSPMTVVESKPSSGYTQQVRTYQTSRSTTSQPTTTTQQQQQQQQYHHNNNNYDNSATYGSPSTSSLQTTRIYQDYMNQHNNHHHLNQHQSSNSPSLVDYNSLPTIIVSKLPGSASTSRVSQTPPHYPPQHDSVYSLDRHTPIVIHTTVSLTTTTMNPTSLATTLPSFSPGEPETATTAQLVTSSVEPSSRPSSHRVPSFVPAGGQDEVPSSAEYGAPDLEPIGDHTVSSFDRVVEGIVGNPNFSKEYPPVPELMEKRKQPAPPNPPVPLSRGPAFSSPPAGTSQSLSASSARINIDQLSSTPAMASSSGSNKRENSKTLSPSIYGGESNPVPAPHQAPDPVSVLAGPDALNISSLFERGGLNDSSRIPSECLDCICDASSNCDTTVQCISKQREKNRCGMYMISWNQYKESDISLTSLMLSPPPSSSSLSSTSTSSSSSTTHQNDDYDEKLYYECSTDKNCAEKLIHLYIEKYSKDCNHDGKIDCYDIAAIHRVGPDNCNSHKFLRSQYWRDFNHCYATDRLTTTAPAQASSQGVK